MHVGLLLFLSIGVKTTFSDEACSSPKRMGIEDGRIQDSQLSVSSFKGSNNREIASRLNSLSSDATYGGGWRPDTGDPNPWIQVDFKKPVTVTGVITQGRNGENKWVTRYMVSYSDDEVNWTNDPTEFAANVDSNTLKENNLSVAVTHRFFRVLPTDWNGYCTLRLEFIGCYLGCRDSSTLGMENHYIHDFQISTSSYLFTRWSSAAARLNRIGDETIGDGWCAHPDDSTPWIQVDFLTKVIVEAIQTQGSVLKDSWVDTFKLECSDNGYDFTEYIEHGVPKVFSGNSDNSAVVKNVINPTVAQYFRIRPLTLGNNFGLRTEFIGCYKDCNSLVALGLENESIKTTQISVSSVFNLDYAEMYGRLNYDMIYGGWRPLDADSDAWFTIDLLKDALISCVDTQGSAHSDMWTESYEVSYSVDGTNFESYKLYNQVLEFKANYDQTTPVKNCFPVTIYAQYIRIHPKECNVACVMRVEIYGCYDGIDNCASVTCQNGGNCTDLVDSFKCDCPSGYLGYLCDLNCSTVYNHGLADGSISDSQLSASSVANSNYAVRTARLGTANNGWLPAYSDYSAWLQVDFEETVNIAIIKTQGIYNGAGLTRTFSVSFGDDGSTFQDYQENGRTKVFKANVDSNTIVQNYFTPNIEARFFRIHPKSFKNRPVLRMELATCTKPCKVVPSGMMSTVIRDSQITASTNYDGEYRDIYARLNHPTGWSPANNDYSSPWLQVDFTLVLTVDAIETQGGGVLSYTKTYSISYGNDGISFQTYDENGAEKIFTGNADTTTIVRNTFLPRIAARYIRVHPETHTYYIVLRAEFYMCSTACLPNNPCHNSGSCALNSSSFDCTCVTHAYGETCQNCSEPVPLSFENGDILDAQFTASSEHESGMYKAKYARLYHKAITDLSSGGWAPSTNDLTNPWLQIDFRVNTTLYRVWIQGENETVNNYKVNQYKVSYSQDGAAFHYYYNNGAIKKFAITLTDDPNYAFTRIFDPLIVARYIRFHPLQWNTHPAMRLEIYGCHGVHFCLINPCLNSGTCQPTSDSYRCICTEGFTGQNCEEQVNFCLSEPCLNSGTCHSSSTGYHCNCAPYFTGQHCEVSQTIETSQPTQQLLSTQSSQPTEPSATPQQSDTTTTLFRTTQNNEAPVTTSRRPTASTSNILLQTSQTVLDLSTHVSPQTTQNINTVTNASPPLSTTPNVLDTTSQASLQTTQSISRATATTPLTQTTSSILRMTSHASLQTPQSINTATNTSPSLQSMQVTPSISRATTTHPLPETTPSANGMTTHDVSPETTHSIYLATITTIPPRQTTQNILGTTSHLSLQTTLSINAVTTAPLHTSPSSFSATTDTSLQTLQSSMSTGQIATMSGTSPPASTSATTPGHLIAGFVLSPILPHEFGQTISVAWTMTSGTDVNVSVTYNNIPCCSAGPLVNTSGQCDCLISDPSVFDPDGVVNITAVASNIADSISSSLEVEVTKVILNASFTMLSAHSDFEIVLQGLESQKNFFPAEYPVKFNSSYTGGPVTTVSWVFVCSVDGTLNLGDGLFLFEATFPSLTSQKCEVTLKLENGISSISVYGSVELQEKATLITMSSNGPVKPNQTTTFTISLEKLGGETCMWVDMGDASPLLVFGATSCEGKFSAPQTYSYRSSTTQEIVINHIYPAVGSYEVRMNASNGVSRFSHNMVAVVLPYVCHNPNVTIAGLTPNTSNVLNAALVNRSTVIALSTENEVNCEKTSRVKTKWTVWKFVDNPRVFNTAPASSLRKILYHQDIPTQDLLLPERDLAYGFYEINVRVEMMGLPDVFGSDSIYVQVVQTPWLDAAVVGGSSHSVAFGLMGVLNSSASSDPDDFGIDGMSFYWYCRDMEDSDFFPSNLTVEPVVSSEDPARLPASGFGGCFGSGRGRINTTNSTLYLDTNKMVENAFYTVLLVVSKDHPEFGLRQAMKTIFLHVTAGIPPQLQTSCAKNCKKKFLPDEKAIFKSVCKSHCTGKLTFSWLLYLYDNVNTSEPFNLSALHKIPEASFMNMALNPIDELDLAIKTDSLQWGLKYNLVFRATRSSGVYGESRSTLLVNSPPADGSCSVSPLSGVALSTEFTFTCEGWTDPDSPLTYELSYGEKQAIIYYRTLTPGTKITRVDRLPPGDETNNFTLTVTIKVKDTYGSSTVEQFMIQVRPLQKKQLNMTVLTNLFATNLKYGDRLSALSIASSLGSTLNTLSSSTSNSKNEDENTALQVREELLFSLTGIKPQDISSTMQVSGSLLLLTANPDQLTSKAQDAALRAADIVADSLKDLAENDSGFKGIKSGVSNVLGALGSMNSGGESASGSISQNKNVTASNVQRTMNAIGKLQNVVLEYLVSNEGPSSIETQQLSISVEKVSAKALGENESKLKRCRFKPPPGAAFGLGEILSNPNGSFFHLQPVDIKLALFDKNPFTWDSTSVNVTSNIIDIIVDSMYLNMSSSNLSEDIKSTISRDPLLFLGNSSSFYLKPHEMNSTNQTRAYSKFHCFTRRSNYTSMNFEIKPEDLGIKLNVYLKKGGRPVAENGDYNYSYELPDFSTCKVGNDSIYTSESKTGYGEAVHIDPKNCLKDPYTVFVSNVDFNGTGEYCFLINHVEQFHNETYPDPETAFSTRHARSVSCEVGARRVRRSCVIIPPAPPKPTETPAGRLKILVADDLGFDGKFFYPNQTPNYNLTMFESSCIFWDVVNETWKGEGCRVVTGTNREQVLCQCNHLTSFGSDLLVAPNPIDFDSVFENFDSLANNVAVLVLISTILVAYILGVIWARRADKKDSLMVGPTILPKPMGNYYYLITTVTGSRQGSGTTARVVFTMTGDEGETPPAWLRDRERPCFERGQTNSFVVSYPHGIGDLSYVQIWHDNSGSSPSWYLNEVIIKDLQTEECWKLICENWLAVESEDGKVCRVLPVANEEELSSFNHVFSKQAVKGLSDGHIWFSIVSRPPASNFTRVQRLSCALCLLCCTMIASAMFYNVAGQGPSPFTLHIGSLVIDMKPFVIGLQSSVIIVPVNILLVQIFRNLRPKEEKQKRAVEYKLEKEDYDKEDTITHDEFEMVTEYVVEGVQIENQNPPKGKLPYFFIYIAYAICYLASAASIFFTLLYSIQWGKETSTEWVISMVTSFFQSVLLLQPIKVVIVAIVCALVLKSSDVSEEEKHDNGLVIRKPEQQTQADAMNLAEQERRMEALRTPSGKRKIYYSPPNPASLRRARKKRLKELKINSAIKEMFAFFLFLILLMYVAQYHRNPNTFLLTKTLYETFEEVDAFGLDLSAISDIDIMWMWSRETLIPGLYANEWYNGKKVEKGYLANMEDYLVGVPRVRLLRVKEDSCTIPSYFIDVIPHCYDDYFSSVEDEKDYNVEWEPLPGSSTRKRREVTEPRTEFEWIKTLESDEMEPNRVGRRHKRGLDPIMGGLSGRKRRKKKRLLASARPKVYIVNDNALLPNGKVLSCLERWRHQTMLQLRGFPYWGRFTIYSGSGYVANLGYDQVTAYTVVADLHSNKWLDIKTRAVFVEFTVYNANTNLFGIVSYFIEFPSSSAAITKSQYQIARFYLHLSTGQTLTHVLVLFCMLYFLYREGKHVYTQRLAYFKGFWNWVEVILIVLEFLFIVLFLARLYEVDRNLLQFRENPNDYVGFQYAASADALMTYILGVLVFFYIIRFLRLLRFNKNFLAIGKILGRVSQPILNFCLPFFVALFAFGTLAFAMFGSVLEDYSSFVRTMATQFGMTLGDFDFEAIYMVNPIVATLYFFSFIGLNVMLLMNMFIAIINDSYAEVQEENAEIQNELEILDYVMAKITQRFHLTVHRDKVVPMIDQKEQYYEKPITYPSYEQTCSELDLRAERLELILYIIGRNIGEDALEVRRFCAVPKDNRKDLFFRVLCLIESVLEDMEEDESEK